MPAGPELFPESLVGFGDSRMRSTARRGCCGLLHPHRHARIGESIVPPGHHQMIAQTIRELFCRRLAARGDEDLETAVRDQRGHQQDVAVVRAHLARVEGRQHRRDQRQRPRQHPLTTALSRRQLRDDLDDGHGIGSQPTQQLCQHMRRRRHPQSGEPLRDSGEQLRFIDGGGTAAKIAPAHH